MVEDEDAQRPIPVWLGLLFGVYGLAVLVGVAWLCYRLLA